MRALVMVALLAGTVHAGELDAIQSAAPTCDQARKHCFAIQLYVAGDASGLAAGPDWIATQLRAANRHFAALDVGFQLAGVEALPESALHIKTRADRNALASGRLGGRVIHVFIVGQLDDVDIEGRVANGVAWRLPGDTRKFLIVSTQAFERTLAHELGHFFGLPHSTYAVSIMNKTERKEPPVDQRTFADEEIAAMRRGLERLVRSRVIVAVKPRG
jgi:hypothetical protein